MVTVNYGGRDMSKKRKIYKRRLVEFLYTDGILLEDLLLMNSPFWTVHPTLSSNVVARRLVIRNPQTPRMTRMDSIRTAL